MDVAHKPLAETIFRAILSGVQLASRGDEPAATKAFAAALLLTRKIPVEQGAALAALALYNTSFLLARRHKEEAQQARAGATALLTRYPPSADEGPVPPPLLPLFELRLAEALMKAGEYRLASPYWERTIDSVLVLEPDNPPGIANILWRAGTCYNRIGLRDHAAVPLRAAAKIFRTLTGDHTFPAVLLDLGNAVRKTSPEEAERYYREAAEYHVARGQLESATPAWANLGVLCNEQGRPSEALEYYEKALHVRMQSRGTPPERIGVLHNNIANVHRKTGRFEEAHASVVRALEILERCGGPYLPNAYGTCGLIYRDQNRDEDALPWFRKSIEEWLKQPSPNLETLCEEIENEAGCLERLGCVREAAHARGRLDEVRASMKSIEATQRDMREPKATEGALLIELQFGGRPSSHGKKDAMRLVNALLQTLQDDGAGRYGGHVTIPETTTLMFYGGDAEAMLRIAEPVLKAERTCAGARVTVRQGSNHREVILPGPFM